MTLQVTAALVLLSITSLSAGSVNCLVVDDIHGAAISGARLVLSGVGIDPPRVGSSDSAGRYSFTDIPAGNHSVTIEKAGYYPRVPGADRSTGLVSVNRDSVDLPCTFVLVKFRAISGSVIPQPTVPLENMNVYAIRVRRGPRELRHEDGQPAQTDDDGSYRISHLAPGRYTVCANARKAPDAAAGTLPVCYPDPVDVRFTDEVSHIVLAPAPSGGGVTVEGTVASLPDIPDGAELFLYLLAPGPPPTAIAATPAQVGRSFRLTGIPPGSYSLVALPKDGRLRELRGVEQARVAAEAVTGLQIILKPSETISGRAELEKGQTAAVPLAGVSVYAESGVLNLSGPAEHVTNAAGEFKLAGAVSGMFYSTTIKSPKGTYVYSVRQGDRTLAGAPFSIAADAGEIHITLRDDGGVIEGTAVRNGVPADYGFVVLAPVDRTQQHLYRVATSAADGSFRLTDIAPGNYDLFGLDQNEDDLFYDADYLKRFLDRATKISVTPSVTTHIDVKVITTGAHPIARQ